MTLFKRKFITLILWLVFAAALLFFSIVSFPIFTSVYGDEYVFRHLVKFFVVDFIILAVASVLFSVSLYNLISYKKFYKSWIKKQASKYKAGY